MTKPFDHIERRGLIFVMSSPSGAGKTTLARRLLAADDSLVMSVSATTRKRRDGEIDGVDYFFKTMETFKADIASRAFLEYAEVFGNYYGTPRAAVEQWLSEGRDVLFDVDWQGAQQLRQAMRDDLAGVFILPPSLKSLGDRLRNRHQDSEEVILGRMERAAAEISHWAEYDYVIVNDDLDRSQEQLLAILQAERARRQRQTGLADFVRDMLSKSQ
jgi:guanylate kinase